MIRSQSLYKSNIVFVFRNDTTMLPENQELMGLYRGEQARGMQFVDDPMMRMKVLDVPAMKLQVACEPRRLRVEDLEAREPEASPLVDEAFSVFQKIAVPRGARLEGIGFNFEFYFQVSDVIRLDDHFNTIASPLDVGDSILDFGWQWTTAHKNGAETHGYFLKITAPLEFAMHHNAHFRVSDPPTLQGLKDLFTKSFAATRRMADTLKL